MGHQLEPWLARIGFHISHFSPDGPGSPGPVCGFLGCEQPKHLGLLCQKPHLPGWMFCVSSFLSLRENSISPEGAQALAQALCMNNTLKHLEYVIIGSGGMEVKGRLCFLTYSDTRVSGHHYDGLDPWNRHSSQGWTRAAWRPDTDWQTLHKNSPALSLEMDKHMGVFPKSWHGTMPIGSKSCS